MGNSKAFMSVPRQEAGHRPKHERTQDFSEVEQTLSESERKLQASRCMDCGVPFCHWACQLGNKQPEWQDAVYRGDWKEAYELLSATNDFPEFTGRICPALCEKSCILNHCIDAPLTVRENECSIIEKAFSEGYVQPKSYKKNGKKVAVIGGGPAGLSAAVRLNAKGYEITIFDMMNKPGGLVRYGIPNFKLDKFIIDRRMQIMEAEGIHFVTGTKIDCNDLPKEYDAYVISTGTPQARDMKIPGRELNGVHFALEMLSQQNRLLEGETFAKKELVSAKGKKVLVIGGGDTGSDCVGTCHRQGATEVTQIEIMPMPPEGHNPATPWPQWPQILKTTTSHEEGCIRRWNLTSNFFIDDGKGQLKGVEVERVEWLPAEPGQRPKMELTGEKEIIDCDMVLLALGFLKPEHPEYPANVFLAGDSKNGASLVVRAIASGRETAQAVDDYLKRN